MTDFAIDIRHLSKHYTDFAIKDLNLILPRGCIMGFIGENGAGKSTTIKLILDLIQRESGEIRVLGSNTPPLDTAVKESIGVVLDESCFPQDLSVATIGKIMKRVYCHWNDIQFEGLVTRFDLPLNKPVKQLSRGMKMKLSMAVALSHGAELLILDEATSGLDPIIRDELLDLFMEFIQDESHAIFVSSHIISDLEKVCDYIAFIHKGELLFCEGKDDLLERFGVLKCTEADLAAIDPSAVRGVRKNAFGVEALVERKALSVGQTVEPANLETIMLYHVKESKQ